jgi:hypothetical protein
MKAGHIGIILLAGGLLVAAIPANTGTETSTPTVTSDLIEKSKASPILRKIASKCIEYQIKANLPAAICSFSKNAEVIRPTNS